MEFELCVIYTQHIKVEVAHMFTIVNNTLIELIRTDVVHDAEFCPFDHFACLSENVYESEM